MRLATLPPVSKLAASKTSIRWSYGRSSDSPFFAFFEISLDVQLAPCRPLPELNNPLAQKDAPTPTTPPAQFIASKTSSVQLPDDSVFSPFFAFSEFSH